MLKAGPLKKIKRKTWAWDIEAEQWDSVTTVCAVSDAGDVEKFSGPGCLERFADQVAERDRGTFVAHAGGIYDTLLYSQVREKPWQELIMSGSAILSANDGTLKLRDSFRWWLSGLGKVGQYLDKVEQQRPQPRHTPGHWLKKDVDRSRIHLLTENEKTEYCLSDCQILLEGIQQAQGYLEDRKARAGWTAGSCALGLLQTLEPASWRILARHALPFETAIGASDCVRGARVENWARGWVPTVYVYDFKSMYPSSYAYKDIGVGAVHLDATDDTRPGAVWRCRWFWPHRDVIPPVLDQVTGAGCGWCEAWIVPEEARLLDEAGVLVQRLEGWAPEDMVPIGQIFSRDLFAEKERGSFFGKVYLNSLHGKFSESPVKTSWTRDKPKTWYGKEPELVGQYWRALQQSLDPDGRCARHVQPLAGAHILGRARAGLYRAIRAVTAAGWEVYYCDTDSVHTNCPPELFPARLGDKMGALAFEGGPFRGCYVAAKAYCLIPHDGSGKIKGALKGIPWTQLKDGVRETSSSGTRYRQARGDDVGADLRVEVFEEAFEPGGVVVVKEGIRSFTHGLRHRLGWAREETQRTLQPIERGKQWQPGGAATTWAYRTPAEVLIGPGDINRPHPHDPADVPDEIDPWQ